MATPPHGSASAKAAGRGWVVGGSFGRLKLDGHVQMQQSS